MVSLFPIILIVFILASLFRIAFIYHVLYVLLAVAVLARAWASLAARRLKVERTFPERALHGETVAVTLTVRNEAPVPLPWLRLHDRVPIALAPGGVFDRALSLAPREATTFTYDLHGRQRGWYQLGPARIETGDVLGLNLFRREFATERRLLVYPKILAPSALGLPSRTPFGDIRTRQPLYEDPARVAGVRDYQSGDSLRRINWRTSAALGRLQVRKLEPAMTLRTSIALDLNLGGYDSGAAHYATELAIVAAASLADHLVGNRQEVGLLSNGRDPAVESSLPLSLFEREGVRPSHDWIHLAPRKGRAQLTRILDTLSRVEARATYALDQLLGDAMGDMSWGATIVVIVGVETPGLTAALTRLRRAGFALMVLVVTQVSPYREGGSGLAGLGIPVHYVWRESDIDDVGEPGSQRRATPLAAR